MPFSKIQILTLASVLFFLNELTLANSDPCEDLFSAACLDSSGESRFKDKQKNNEKKLQEKIKQARDLAAQRQRFRNFNDLQRARLEQAGIPLVEGFDVDRFSNNDESARLRPADIFRDANQCRTAQQQFENANVYQMQNVTEIEAQAVQRAQAAERFQTVRDSYYAKDIPQFMRDLSTRCQLLSNSTTYDPAQNTEMSQVCGRLQSVRTEAIDLFRQERQPDYRQRALEFISRNRIRSLVVRIPATPDVGGNSGMIMGGGLGLPIPGGYGGMLGGPVVSGTSNPYAQLTPEAMAELQRIQQQQQQTLQEQLQLTQIRMRADAALREVSEMCGEVNSIIMAASKDVVMATLQESSRDRVTIETLIDSVYTPDRRARVQQMFNQARQSVADFAQLNVSDQTRRNTIVSGLDEMELGWLEKPTSEMYINNRGRQILNIDDPVVANTPGSEIWSNPGLSFFTETNAFYAPVRSFGRSRNAETVTLHPTMLELLDENPDAIRFVIGHEVGHRLGPRISELNGYGMSGEYAALLDCYRNSGSIRMRENQKDEVIADYIGAEVVAQQVAALPAADRRNALMRSVEFFCMTDSNDGHGSVNCRNSHPEQILRVSGIFGANPSIRNLLGCNGESSRYKTCGAGRSILESPNSRAGSRERTNGRATPTPPSDATRQNRNRGPVVR
jgi:hypothetical protein